MRKFLLFFSLIFFVVHSRAQNVNVEVDGDNLYYFESGCADCNGDPDPRWRARCYVGGTGPYDWNHDHDEVCGWCNHTNYSWVNTLTKPITDNITIQMNGWESDGGICGGDDYDCGGYSTIFNAAIGIQNPCGWRYSTDSRTCGGGNYQIYWSYYWVYAQAPTITVQPISNTSACIGTPVTLTVAVNNDAYGRSMGMYYQWQRSTNTSCAGASGWTDIAGAISASYTVPQTSGTRLYRCLITSNCSADFTSNTATSNCARVTYHPMNGSGGGDNPPAIQSSICGQTILPGSSHVLNTLQPPSVGAVANLTGYNWSASGGSLSSTTGSSTTWTAPGTQGVYSITVTYQNASCGNYTSVCNVTVAQPACDFVYVSPTGLDIISNGGPDNPFATLSYAVTQAQANSKNYIRMLKGNYTENNVVNLFSNLIIEGGYVITGTNWIKSSSTTAPANTSITFNAQEDIDANSGHRVGIKSDGISGWALQDLYITTSAASGQVASGRGRSNYAIWINNSSNYNITRCNITSGNAAAGVGGSSGVGGNVGQTGNNGGAGDIDSQCAGGQGGKGGNGATNGVNGGSGGPQANLCCTCGTPNGNNGNSSTNYRGGGGGGSGGPGGSENRSGGASGRGREGGASAALNPSGAAGGGGSGGCGSNCGGRSGANGASGPNGASGSPNYTIGDLTGAPAVSYGSYFVPAGQSNSGGDGQGGTGGNGGGGGAGQGGGSCVDGSGSGGGGGGGGGEGGAGGTGAFGGGGTFGIYRNNSSTGATLTDIVVSSGAAGSGGSGGSGGGSGGGGGGGTGPNPSGGCGETGKGGNGGAGGSGGSGGRGQDGRPGTNGQLYTVGTGFTSPSSAIPNPTTVTINYNNTKGCINSEIEITKAAGSWTLPGGLNYANDVNSTTSSYSNASSPAIIQTPSTGAYDLTANGGTYNDYLRIIDGSRPLPTITINPSSACFGATFSLTAGSLYGTTVEYDWRIFSNNANTPDGPGITSSLAAPSFSLTTPGTYNVRLRIKEICCGWSRPVYASFSVAPDLLAGAVSSSQNICVGSDPALLSETTPASGGIGAITYSWEYQDNCSGPWIPIVGATSSTYDPPGGLLTDRCYRRVATNTCGTVYSNSITVTVNPLPTANAGSNQSICNGESVQIGAPAEAGNTYSWSPATNLSDPNISSPSANPSGSTVYTLTETITATGCQNSNSVTVFINPLPAANTGFDQTLCTGQSVMLGAAPVAGNTYSWNPGTSLDDSTFSNPTTTATGTITYTLTEINTTTGCTDSNTVTVTVNPVPVAVAGSDQTICEGQTITLGASPVGGNTYSWSPTNNLSSFIVSNPDASPTATTTYTLTETISATGCQKSNSVTITVNPAPAANTGANQTICNSQSVQLGAAPVAGNSYSWLPATSLDDATISNPTSSSSSTITYTLTETVGATGCQKSNSVTLTVNALPAAVAGTDQTICDNQTISLGAAPVAGNSYAWSPSSSLSDPNVANPNANPSGTITYTLVETVVATGCKDSNTVTISVNPAPAAFTGADQTICDGQIATLGTTPVGGNTYSWSPSTSLDDTAAANPNANPNATITYSLTETVSATGCLETNSVTVTVNPVPAAIAGFDQTICDGQSVMIGAPSVGGNTYSWSPGTNLSSGTVSNPTANPSDTILYTLTETITATGCQNSNSVTIIVNPLPAAFTGTDQIICENSSVQLGTSSVAGNTYNWVPSTGLNSTTLSDPDASPVVTTTYTLTETVTATGCNRSNSVIVNVNPAPAAFTGTDQTICDEQNVQLGTTAVAGNTYNWNPSANLDDSTLSNPTANPSATTTFTLTETITATGCQHSNAVTVNVNALPVVTFSGLSAAYCIDAPAALLNGSPFGGTFSGSGISGNTFDPGVAGVGGPYPINYTFTDGNSCANDTTISTVVNDLPGVTYSGFSGPYCASIIIPVTLTGNPSGGTFSGPGISGNDFYPNIANVGNNIIVYNYTDGNSCANSYTDSVTVIGVPYASFTGLDTNYCVDDNNAVTLTGTPSGGTFSGSGISGNIFTPANAGAGNQTITYTFTDGNGCTNSQNQSTTVNSLPLLTFSGLDTSYCINGTDDALTGFPAGGLFSGTGMSGSDFSPSTAGTGTHSITYAFTDGNTCTNDTTITTNVYDAPVVAFSGLAAGYCENAPSALLSGTPAGGSFSGNGISGNSFYPSIAGVGTHSITYSYSDVNNCSSLQNQPVDIYSAPVVSFSGLVASYCSDASPVTLTGNPSGGNFSGPGITGNQFDPAVAGAGTHVIKYIYSDANGCTDSSSQNVIVNAVPVIDFAGLDTAYCINNAGEILTGFPAGGSFSGNGISGNSFDPASAGTGNQAIVYTYTDGNSCTAAITKNTIVNPAPVATITPSGPVTFCQGNSVALTAAANTTYQWSTGAITQTITASTSGNYFVTVTNASNCSSSASIAINANNNPSVTVSSVTDASCNGSSDGSASVNVSGGTFPYSYLWDSNASNQTSPAATGLGAGNYNVTVTDMNSCSATASVTVNNPSGLNASTASVNTCTGGSIGTATVNVTGGTSPYNYLWDSNALNQVSSTATGLSAGTYSVTVTDSNACTFVTSQSVTAADAVFISSSFNASCTGGNTGSATAIGNGGTTPYNYLWDNAAGNQTASTATGLAAGTYTMTTTDANSCTGALSVTINAVSTINTSMGSTPSCNGGSTGTATVSPSGGTIPYSYGWDANATNQTSPTATGLVAGNYSVTVTDANSCTAIVTVNVSSVAGITITTSANGGCSGGNSGSATAIVSGGTAPYTYQWDASTGNQTTATATGLGSGNYTVTVSDINGCTAGNSATITVPSAIISNVTVTNVNCNNDNSGSALASASGGNSPYTYLWSDGQTTSNAIGLSAGTYSVIITDLNGCNDTVPFTVTEPLPLFVSDTSSPADCGSNNGSATVTASGGTIPYSYLWDGAALNQSSPTATGLSTGIYSVTITDGNGCNANTTVIVNGSSGISLGVTSTNVSCNGGNDGTAVVVANGGSTPFTYQWSNGQTSSNATGLSQGNYSVTVTNAEGCSANDEVTVTQPPPVVASISNDTTICSGDSIDLAVTGGSSYLWASGQNTAVIRVAPAASTIYSAAVFDNSGCMTTVTATVTVISLVVADIGGDTAVCLGKPASLIATGGTDYLWNTGETTQTILVSPVTSGIYSVSVSNTCFNDTTSILVNVNYINASASSDTTILIGESVQLNAIGGVLFSWDPPSDLSCTSCPDPIANPLVNTVYMVTITDAMGCADIDTVSIEVDDSKALFVPNIFSPNGDGENDVLYVFGKGIVKINLSIYDRWGEKVFETEDINKGWDGISAVNTPLNTGVYVYHLVVEFYDGTGESREGNVTLVK